MFEINRKNYNRMYKINDKINVDIFLFNNKIINNSFIP